ncbi:hypothetical protein, partial [Enterobacter hormaechei]|uniref:hypothetical protein n=1 Tax=Enterobacter hormaechei TaxID=158836 RepID=UPI001C3EB8B3
ILILFLGYNVPLKTKYACGKMKSTGDKTARMSECILIKRIHQDREKKEINKQVYICDIHCNLNIL